MLKEVEIIIMIHVRRNNTYNINYIFHKLYAIQKYIQY